MGKEEPKRRGASKPTCQYDRSQAKVNYKSDVAGLENVVFEYGLQSTPPSMLKQRKP